MKIQKGHYVPKELITSEAVHEAVVKCFVAAGFKDCRPMYGNFKRMQSFAGLSADNQGEISWGDKGSSAKEPLTLQQLFTAENGLKWPDWAESICTNGESVYFCNDVKFSFIVGSSFGGDVELLATRQPKEKEVNELLDRAVIDHDGVWPQTEAGDDGVIVKCIGVGFSAKKYQYSTRTELLICKKPEFEKRAKELGYINGYRWGVEYPNNGKRPGLPSEVFVQPSISGINWLQCSHKVSDIDWNVAGAFKISDVRYKPADTSYLNAQPQDQSLTHSEEGLTHSWHERGELPPIGVECEAIFPDDTAPEWITAEVLYTSEQNTIVLFGDVEDSYKTSRLKEVCKFRPIRTEREKFIDDGCAAMKTQHHTVKANLGLLFDAGFRGPKVEK